MLIIIQIIKPEDVFTFSPFRVYSRDKKKYTTTWDPFITISLPESFFYDFKGLMPRASVETCLDGVINGMITSGTNEWSTSQRIPSNSLWFYTIYNQNKFKRHQDLI